MAWPRARRVVRKPRGAKPVPLVPLEEDEQATVIAYLQKLPAPWNDTYYAVPNDGRRGWNAQRLFKKLGGVRGVPDLVCPIPHKPYHGLYLEMKRTKGSVTTAEQLEWQARLVSQGYRSVICKGAAEAIEVIKEYRKGKLW